MQGNFDYKSTFMRNTPYQIQAPKPKVLLTSARNVLGDYSNASYWKFNNITHKQSYVDTSINRYQPQFNAFAKVLPPDILD